MEGQTVVRRTVGFARDFAFVGETTVVGRSGVPVTATEFGHTEAGAAQRSQMAARDRAVFAGAQRVAGFVKATVFRTDNHAAPYRPGFVTAFRTDNKRAGFAPGFA